MLGFLLATFLISMWMSNTATTLVMLPTRHLLLASLQEYARPNQGGDNAKRRSINLSAVLLGIAYAASIGGVTTLVGTPTNIVFGDLWIRSFPQADRISAGEWMFVWVLRIDVSAALLGPALLELAFDGRLRHRGTVIFSHTAA
ncbi:MAG: SLC13 family permease [Planctomycetaceae bacterium]